MLERNDLLKEKMTLLRQTVLRKLEDTILVMKVDRGEGELFFPASPKC